MGSTLFRYQFLPGCEDICVHFEWRHQWKEGRERMLVSVLYAPALKPKIFQLLHLGVGEEVFSKLAIPLPGGTLVGKDA